MNHLILPCLLVLSACAPMTTYYKPGATVSALGRATTECQVKALKDVPTSVQVRRLPPEYVPPRRICNAAGQCRVLRGHYIPGEVISFDPNDGLRRRVEGQCMADRGYAPVTIPACPDGVARAAPRAATTTLPSLRETSCVIRNRDGSFQIVNRG